MSDFKTYLLNSKENINLEINDLNNSVSLNETGIKLLKDYKKELDGISVKKSEFKFESDNKLFIDIKDQLSSLQKKF